jgi:hypothetical protein
MNTQPGTMTSRPTVTDDPEINRLTARAREVIDRLTITMPRSTDAERMALATAATQLSQAFFEGVHAGAKLLASEIAAEPLRNELAARTAWSLTAWQ